MKAYFRTERLATAVPLVLALGLSAVVSQVGLQVGKAVFPKDDQVAVTAQALLGDTQSIAGTRALPVNAARAASQVTAGIPPALSVEAFDVVRVRAVIAASALSGTEKALFARALDVAKDRPELLAQVLSGLNSALQRQG